MEAFENIPGELRSLDHWLFANRHKAPSNKFGKPVDATNSENWHTFEEVVAHLDSNDFNEEKLLRFPGFALTPEDPYILVDLDIYRIAAKETRTATEQWADGLHTYSERSASGKGMHLILKLQAGAEWTLPWSKRKHLEVYFKHFAILTGQEAKGEIRTVSMEQLEKSLSRLPGIGKPRLANQKNVDHQKPFKDQVNTLEEVFSRMKSAPDNEKFLSVFNGSLTWHDGDDSRADFYLCKVFARFTYAPVKIKSFWAQSKLSNRDKFLRSDYVERTIMAAIKYDQEQARLNADRPNGTIAEPWFKQHLHIIDDKVYSFTPSLQHIRLCLADFGAKHVSDLRTVFAEITERGRRYGEGYTLEHLSTIQNKKPLIQFCEEGIRVYHPLRDSTVLAIDDTFTLFAFLFREHKDFILDWLAVYVCRNGLRLPQLILTGSRGVGKGTVLAFVARIFPGVLSDVMHSLPSDFNDWATKKFIGLDEFQGNEKKLYDLLKHTQGSDTFSVNPKGEPRFKTRNNLSIIVTANDRDPIWCQATELPVSPLRNPWFVLHLAHVRPGENYPLSEPQVASVVEGAPNFASEVLIPRYRQMEASGVIAQRLRWTIPCPITDDLKALFNESVSELDYFADLVLASIVKDHPEEVAITEGLVDEVLRQKSDANIKRFGPRAIITRLKALGRIAPRRTTKTKTTKGDGYKILQVRKSEEPEPRVIGTPPEEEVAF